MKRTMHSRIKETKKFSEAHGKSWSIDGRISDALADVVEDWMHF
jgi:hypothetical protein